MKYIVDESRLRELIIEIVKTLEIDGLYRVQVNLNLEGKTPVAVALFMDKVSTSDFHYIVQKNTENTIKSFLGIDPFVIVIPYSEVKYHLREPKNI